MPCNGTKGQIFIPKGLLDNYLFIILSYEALHIRSTHRIIHIFNFQLWFLKHIRIDQDRPYTLPMKWMTWRHDTLFSLEWSPTLPLFQKRLTFHTLALIALIPPPLFSFHFNFTHIHWLPQTTPLFTPSIHSPLSPSIQLPPFTRPTTPPS